MQFHTGRLLDHVHLRVRDLAASRRFYQAVLRTLGRGVTMQAEHFFGSDELFLSDLEWPGKTGEPTARVHLAFQTPDRATVHRFYEAALTAGGRDNGAPGERAYHPGYYAAFVLDPDGNNIEAVYHGPAQRSAESVVITPT
ncbi:MAG TPA: VOC family protein [Polyangia bacterium]|nr:VOC family protein [Polyangia bacterium]